MENFRNIYLNKDIYIIASGKSIDFIDKSFFNGKITIGINQSYKYLEPTYLVRKEHEFIDMILKETSDNVIHFISKGNCGGHIKFIDKKYENIKNIVIFDHDNNHHGLNILPNNDNKLVVSFSTITTGIHLAAFMGAKNIILVGHDCGSLNNESNFTNYHTKKTMLQENINEYQLWLKEIEEHTIKLKQLLKEKYNCNILSLNPFINFNLEGNKYTK